MFQKASNKIQFLNGSWERRERERERKIKQLQMNERLILIFRYNYMDFAVKTN